MLQNGVARAILAAWIPVVLIAFRALGPRFGVPFGLFGGYLLLPRWPIPGWSVFGLFDLDKRSLPGLAVALAVVLFDRRALARFRPSRIDLLMLGYVLAPLASAAANGMGAVLVRGSIAESFVHLTEWSLPYVIGRIYYTEGDGPRRLSFDIVVAALVCIPAIVFEAILGPSWYLGKLLYGIDLYGNAHQRLGGWRPEILVSNGLELTEWMALAAVLATWMGFFCRRKPSPLPAWIPPPALVAATLACRSLYGFAPLAAGLVATVSAALIRGRAVVLALALVAPAYMAARTSGLWDGQNLVDLASWVGNRGTTFERIKAEDQFLAEVRGHRIVFGLGGRWPDWRADGQWVTTLAGSGVVGLALMYGSLLIPAALVAWRRGSRASSLSPEMGLALVVVLHAICTLHNMALIVAVPLIAGVLTGVDRVDVARPRPRGGPSKSGAGHATYRVGDFARVSTPTEEPADAQGVVAFVLAVACGLYIFGHAAVEGWEGAKFVGSLGSGLLFAAVGATAAGGRRHPLARVAAFGLAFGALGISFNLALHASTRPVWSADILQGMALSGVAVACWRSLLGGSPLAYAGLAALAATCWAIVPGLRTFPGSQYLFDPGGGGLSLFPAFPWLTLAAVGALLALVSTTGRWALSGLFGLGACWAWGVGTPFGPPIKFPLNPTYALLGASMASAAFALSMPARRWKPIRAGSDWLGRRWLVFFYVHLGLATGLRTVGLTRPGLTWAVLAAVSSLATWIVWEGSGWLRPPFRRPTTWVVLGGLTLAVGRVPGVPTVGVLAVAGTCGLLLGSRLDDLADLVLGPPSVESKAIKAGGDWPGDLARLALVVAVLVAPELVARLPAPFGQGPRPGSPPVVDRATVPKP